jgi:ATP-dependent Zn protease
MTRWAGRHVKVSFGDVAGVDEAEEALKEIVEFHPCKSPAPRSPGSPGSSRP